VHNFYLIEATIVIFTILGWISVAGLQVFCWFCWIFKTLEIWEWNESVHCYY